MSAAAFESRLGIVAIRTCRDEVLAAAQELSTRSADGGFTVDEVVRLPTGRGTTYAESTIRTHVTSRMCANAPANHVTRYADLVRDERGRYRLAARTGVTAGSALPLPRDAARSDEELLAEVPAGSSRVQRKAEAVILEEVSRLLGYSVTPSRLHLPEGEYVEVDGVSHSPPTLVEAWAHQGLAKVAQKHKVLADALKLVHVRQQLGGLHRLILCFSDEQAARGFRPESRTWYAAALKSHGVEVLVVDLPTVWRERIRSAQRLQFR